ncbi:sulfate ABC transporter substrate-binding protein [Paenibacillus sp. N1-5-1-14]|nr:sulfate ABC transporter substrate-binding protein [Paenibacillus radicibacter]MCR8641344.1 sulfate ABC transporter substrate-binding protein [Paenibacillus radicibacter]
MMTMVACGKSSPSQSTQPVELINVSYDPTRELYRDYNQAFEAYWKQLKGQDVVIRQSHGGSGKQARTVIDGLQADVVTLALENDINQLKKVGLVQGDWQSRLPDRSAPYTSTIVFLVRKGNPKEIHDWPDLIKPGVEVITPNPKTSGGARWNYMAAWGYALKTSNKSEAAAKDFVTKLYQNVKVLGTGARDSTTTFVEQGIGDVLITWENEAMLTTKDVGKDDYEIVLPSMSILAEPPVAVVDQVVDKKGTREVAEAYLQYLYTKEGQTLAAEHYFRPTMPEVVEQFRATFPSIPLFRIDDPDLGGWDLVQKKHFSDNGVFDSIYKLAK